MVVLGALLFGAVAFALWPNGSSESIDEHTNRLAAQFRCVDCEGLSVAESSTASARAQRRDIETRIRDGQSDATIRRVFADRFGDSILLEPPAEGVGLLLWTLPVTVIIVGAGCLIFAVRRWRRADGVNDDVVDALDGFARDESANPSPARRIGVAVALVGFAIATGIALAIGTGVRAPGSNPTGRSAESAQVSDESRALMLEAAVDRAPGDALAHLALARFRLGRQDRAGALEAYRQAATLDPTDPEPFAYSGWVIRLGGFPDEGLELIDKAIAIDPLYPDARFFRGTILLRDRGDPASAIPEFQRYLVGDPGGPMANAVRGLLAEAVKASPTTLPKQASR